MKEIIIAIIFIIIALTAIAATAFGQDAWYEVAEASGISYYVPTVNREVPLGKNTACDYYAIKKIVIKSVYFESSFRNTFGTLNVSPSGGVASGNNGDF